MNIRTWVTNQTNNLIGEVVKEEIVQSQYGDEKVYEVKLSNRLPNQVWLEKDTRVYKTEEVKFPRLR